jgi:hypothetical protein
MANEEMEYQDSETPEGNEETLDTQDEGSEQETEQKSSEKDYEELYKNQRIRAEKAEQELKKFREKPTETKSDSNLSQKDLIALIKADVTEDDDIQEVVDYAKLKKVSVSEAIKSNVLRSILDNNKEERATARATSVGNKREGQSYANDDALLSKAKSGDLPSSTDEISRLVDARFKSKLQKRR